MSFLFRSMYNKTIIRFGFCDIQNNQGLGKGYQITPTSALIILDITNTSSSNCLSLNLLLAFLAPDFLATFLHVKLPADYCDRERFLTALSKKFHLANHKKRK